MTTSLPIGIDFGTSNTVAAVFRDGRCEIIPNKNGDRFTPSLVFYHPENDDVTVGKAAEELSTSKIGNFIFDVKRFIGRKYDDVCVQALRSSDEHRFEIVDGAKGNATVRLERNGAIVHKTPAEIASEVLKYVKVRATEYLGCPVTEAVISVPAYFDDSQRNATKLAAQLAGFKVLKLISEPVAAALSYTESFPDTELAAASGKLLVFDFGGGTLDVSVIGVNRRVFEVRRVAGDAHLGGRDIDQILLDHFKSSLVSDIDDTLMRRLVAKVVSLKHKLSECQYFSTVLECYGDRKKLHVAMSRRQLEKSCKSVFVGGMAVVKKCLREADLTKRDIDAVLLVGGSTRLPAIRRRLADYFGDEIIRTDLDPDEAVALGAAFQAAVAKRGFVGGLHQTMPLSLRIACAANLAEPIIHQRTILPTKPVVSWCTTHRNNQTSMAIHIYEGERPNVKDNRYLAHFNIEGLPLGRCGEVHVRGEFSMDENYTLTAELRVIGAEKVIRRTVSLDYCPASERQVQELCDEAKAHQKTDATFRTIARYNQLVAKKLRHAIYDLDRIESREQRQLVGEKCHELLKYLSEYDNNGPEPLTTRYDAVRGEIGQYVASYVDLDVKPPALEPEPEIGCSLM